MGARGGDKGMLMPSLVAVACLGCVLVSTLFAAADGSPALVAVAVRCRRGRTRTVAMGNIVDDEASLSGHVNYTSGRNATAGSSPRLVKTPLSGSFGLWPFHWVRFQMEKFYWLQRPLSAKADHTALSLAE